MLAILSVACGARCGGPAARAAQNFDIEVLNFDIEVLRYPLQILCGTIPIQLSLRIGGLEYPSVTGTRWISNCGQSLISVE
jgi:hypothetical protein